MQKGTEEMQFMYKNKLYLEFIVSNSPSDQAPCLWMSDDIARKMGRFNQASPHY